MNGNIRAKYASIRDVTYVTEKCSFSKLTFSFAPTGYEGDHFDTVFGKLYPQGNGPRAEGGLCRPVHAQTRQEFLGAVAAYHNDSAFVGQYNRHEDLRDSHCPY